MKKRKQKPARKTKAKIYPAIVDSALTIHLWSDDPEIVEMAVEELGKVVLQRWHQDNLALAQMEEES